MGDREVKIPPEWKEEVEELLTLPGPRKTTPPNKPTKKSTDEKAKQPARMSIRKPARSGEVKK